MIWLTWRQQRLEAMIGASVLTLVTMLLIWSGHDMSLAYKNMGVATCLAHDPSPQACQAVAQAFQTRFSSLTGLATWLNFLPLLFGVLLAAPFVLDLEHGTYRLAWTQSITRRRWVRVKLGLIVAIVVLVSLFLTILTSWWNNPTDHIVSRLDPNQFDFEGTVPIAYTIFVAALCLAMGSILRRSIPAIGITLAGYLALRTVIETWVRYHYLAPVTKRIPFAAAAADQPVPTRGDYFIKAGASIPKDIMRLCFGGSLQPPPPNAAGPSYACFQHHGVFASVVYQPANRFWLFQGIESAIFLIPSIALLALAVWWVRYRIT